MGTFLGRNVFGLGVRYVRIRVWGRVKARHVMVGVGVGVENEWKSM